MTTDLVLVVHFLWFLWMVSGVVVAVAGFVWPRVWGWRVFRSLHVVGLIGTASVPLWAERGLCPLTLLEWELADRGSGGPDSFIIRMMSDILYVDISPTTLSIATAFAALITIVVFVMRPPWRYRRR